MPDEIDTDDLMVAVRAAGDGAGAEGGTEPVVPVVSPAAAPAAAGRLGRAALRAAGIRLANPPFFRQVHW